MIAVIKLKQAIGKELQTITRNVDLDYYDHSSFDDIVEDCLLKMQSHNDVRSVEIVIKKE